MTAPALTDAQRALLAIIEATFSRWSTQTNTRDGAITLHWIGYPEPWDLSIELTPDGGARLEGELGNAPVGPFTARGGTDIPALLDLARDFLRAHKGAA